MPAALVLFPKLNSLPVLILLRFLVHGISQTHPFPPSTPQRIGMNLTPPQMRNPADRNTTHHWSLYHQTVCHSLLPCLWLRSWTQLLPRKYRLGLQIPGQLHDYDPYAFYDFHDVYPLSSGGDIIYAYYWTRETLYNCWFCWTMRSVYDYTVLSNKLNRICTKHSKYNVHTMSIPINIPASTAIGSCGIYHWGSTWYGLVTQWVCYTPSIHRCESVCDNTLSQQI